MRYITFMVKNIIPASAVLEFVGASKDDLSNWARLPPEHSLRLAPVSPPRAPREYDLEEVIAFLRRNPDRLAIVLAAYAPPEVVEQFALPMARASHTAQTHRG